MTPEQKTEIEAAAWRTLVGHLQKRADVQNIDLMNLAGFCRNCMSRWMANAAAQQGVELSEPSAREMIYGMTYEVEISPPNGGHARATGALQATGAGRHHRIAGRDGVRQAHAG